MATVVGCSCSAPHPSHHLLVLGFFLTLFLQTFEVEPSTFNYTRYRKVSSLRFQRIQRHLDNINKPPVLTIESPDGDLIDCVHKRKQPALDHPLLKNHKIQKVPTKMPRGMKRVEEKEMEIRNAWQMWHKNGTRCPKGTVPIRRSTVHDVFRAKSLFDFGKKQRRFRLTRRSDAPDVVSGNGHEVRTFHRNDRGPETYPMHAPDGCTTMDTELQ